MSDLAVEIQAEIYRELLRWREYLPRLAEAVRKVLGENAEIYVFGSAIENRLTASSDIDIAVVVDKVPEKATERARILDEIWRELEARGVPWWYPFEIHLMSRREVELLRRGGAKFARLEDIIRG